MKKSWPHPRGISGQVFIESFNMDTECWMYGSRGKCVQEEEGEIVSRFSLVMEIIDGRECSQRIVVSAASPFFIDCLKMFPSRTVFEPAGEAGCSLCRSEREAEFDCERESQSLGEE